MASQLELETNRYETIDVNQSFVRAKFVQGSRDDALIGGAGHMQRESPLSPCGSSTGNLIEMEGEKSGRTVHTSSAALHIYSQRLQAGRQNAFLS